jgi:hypothetical protein
MGGGKWLNEEIVPFVLFGNKSECLPQYQVDLIVMMPCLRQKLYWATVNSDSKVHPPAH